MEKLGDTLSLIYFSFPQTSQGPAWKELQDCLSSTGLGVQSNSRLHRVREAWATGDIDINQLFSIFLMLWSFKTVPPDVLNLQLLNYFHCYFIIIFLLLLWIII